MAGKKRAESEAGTSAGNGDGQRMDARRAAEIAAGYLDEMTGQPPEVVTGVRPDEDGWLVRVEVLELARIPNTTDVLGCYEILVGRSGEPLSYRRIRRYHRGEVGED